MFRVLARLLGLAIGASLVAGTASALAALALRKNAPPVPQPADDEIDFVTVMDGAELASSATAFRGGRVVCWYAGVDLDLRDATLDPDGARLEVRTVFGGTRVVVSSGVPVRITGPAIFGGAMNSTDSTKASAEAPGLEITGFTLFGGLQVITAEHGEAISSWSGRKAQTPGEQGHDLEQSAPSLEVAGDITPA